MKKVVRFGVIGIGNMGSSHCQNLFDGKVEGATLAAACDINPDRLTWVKEQFGDGIALFEDSDALIQSGLVDAVLIATPHYFHPPMGIAAMKAGLHVLSEKPAGVYTKQVQELIDVAKESDTLYGIMYNQRTNPIYSKVRDMIANGELGEMKRSIWIITNWYRTQSYYDSGTWRATWNGEGGGVLINQCPHNLDLWQWICGMPSRVRAAGYEGKYHNIEVEDDVTAYVEYPNGATGLFVTTTGEAPGTNRLEISGTKGKIVVDQGLKITFWRLETDEREFNAVDQTGFGQPKCVIEEIKPEGVETAHVGIMQNFTNAILNGEKLLAPGEDGIKGLTISNAIHLSAWTDGWVDLPIDAELYLEKLNEKRAASQTKTDAAGRVLDLKDSFR